MPLGYDRVCSPRSLEVALTEYLNLNSTREILGIDSKRTDKWAMSSGAVANAFGGISGRNADLHDPTYLYVAGLLERGVKVLVYAGKGEFTATQKRADR